MPKDVNAQIEKLILAKNEAGILTLLKSGAAQPNDTFEVSGYNLQLLPAAQERSWDELAVYLIEHGVNLKASRGRRAILSACTTRSHKVIEALIAAGVSVNVKAAKMDGEADYTPLMVAAEGRDPWAVRRLLAAGADPTTQTCRHETAVHHALMYYFVGPKPEPAATEIVKVLLDAGCPLLGTELHYPVYRRDVAMTKLLLDRGSPVNVLLAHKGSHEKPGPKKGDSLLKTAERINTVDLIGGNVGFEVTDARREAIIEMLRTAGAT